MNTLLQGLRSNPLLWLLAAVPAVFIGARVAPESHTILFVLAVLAIAVAFVLARKDFPANTVQELIVWLKANPGKATGGTSGAGSSGQLASILFQSQTDSRSFPIAAQPLRCRIWSAGRSMRAICG